MKAFVRDYRLGEARSQPGVNPPPVAGLQAGYYAASGAMPLLAYRLFERITGPKREPWLVKTVGLITVAVAWVLANDPAGRHRQTRRLGVASALAYGAIDVWYAAVRRRISPVYLLDAAVEAALVGAWLVLPRRPRRTGVYGEHG